MFKTKSATVLRGKSASGTQRKWMWDDSAHVVYSVKGRICFVKVKWAVIP